MMRYVFAYFTTVNYLWVEVPFLYPYSLQIYSSKIKDKTKDKWRKISKIVFYIWGTRQMPCGQRHRFCSPFLLPATPEAFFKSSFSWEADRKCWNHSSFSLPVLPNRKRVRSLLDEDDHPPVPSPLSLVLELSPGSNLSPSAFDMKSSCLPSSMHMGYFLFHIRFLARLGGAKYT